MVMQASRNGYFFVLDRTNGKSLLTVPYGPVNWATGIAAPPGRSFRNVTTSELIHSPS